MRGAERERERGWGGGGGGRERVKEIRYEPCLVSIKLCQCAVKAILETIEEKRVG